MIMNNSFVWLKSMINIRLTDSNTYSLFCTKIILSPSWWIQWVGSNAKELFFIFEYAELAKLDIRHFFSRSGWYSLSIQDDFILLFLVIWIYIRRYYFCLSLFFGCFVYLFIVFSFLYSHEHDGMIRSG